MDDTKQTAEQIAAGTVPANPATKVLRTALQTILGLATLLALVIPQIPQDAIPWPWLSAGLAGALAVALFITRVMAIPAVNDAIRKLVPALATNEVDAAKVEVVKSGGELVAGQASGLDTGDPVHDVVPG